MAALGLNSVLDNTMIQTEGGHGGPPLQYVPSYLYLLREIVLETIRALPDAERIEFMAAVQKGLDQLDSGEGIPHDELKRQLASWLTN